MRGLAQLALIPTLLTTVPAYAAEIRVFHASESQEALIAIEGDIEEGDDAKFRQIAAEYSDAIVVLDSDGGAIMPAMDIGRTIRLREYTTTVYKNGSCTSACALIWVAGARRTIFEGGKVGFHASYMNVDGTLIEAGMGNALVGHYLSQLGMGQKTVIFATAAPPDKILWLDGQTSALSGVEYEIIPNEKPQNSEKSDSPPEKPLKPPVITTVPKQEQPSLGEHSGMPQPSYRHLIAATTETIRNVEAFAQGLRQKGFQADVDRSDPDSPSIFTGIEGNKALISFSSCSDMDCNYAQIISTWSQVDDHLASDVVNSWAREENFSSALYLPNSQSVAVYHYIILGSDGITLQNMMENLDYFSKDYREIGSRLAGGS